MNILLVEDNDGDIELTERAFRKGNLAAKLSVAHDGVEALEMLGRKGDRGAALRPDLILLDLNMPRMDGREFLAAIKSDPDLKSIPVIMLTSSNAPRDISECYERHANCYIIKPFGTEKFTAMVKQLDEFWTGIVRLPPTATH